MVEDVEKVAERGGLTARRRVGQQLRVVRRQHAQRPASPMNVTHIVAGADSPILVVRTP